MGRGPQKHIDPTTRATESEIVFNLLNIGALTFLLTCGNSAVMIQNLRLDSEQAPPPQRNLNTASESICQDLNSKMVDLLT